MKPKIAGCCTKCDAEVFEVLTRDPAGLPSKISIPHDDAMRVNFVLIDGSRMDLTFCRSCAEGLGPDDYPYLWQRVMCSWGAQTPGHPHIKTQTNNAILGLLNMKPWREVR